MKTQSYLEEIRSNFSIADGAKRREMLIREMDKLGDKEVNCHSCTGKCCTYVANSVQIDPLQALELLNYLIIEKRWDSELIIKLEKNIKDFRLDNEISLGRGKLLRRYYTCPFFVGGSKGCTIDPYFKPYGCLGFNPSLVGSAEGDGCSSNLELLESRETKFSESEEMANTFLKKELNIYWDKKPIPAALIDLAKLLN